MWRKWITRLKALVSRRQFDTETGDEVNFHIEMQTRANIASGMSADEARYAALRAFGGKDLAAEACRDTRRTWLDSVVQDVRFALRSFRLNPLFSTTAVVTLGLGIAAALSITSIVDATLVRPLPFPNASRVVQVSEYNLKDPEQPWGIRSFYLAPLSSSGSFDAVATYDDYPARRYTVAKSGGALMLNGVHVSADFFGVLGVQPFLGRGFTSTDDAVDSPRVCVLTYTAWMRRFGGDRGIVGRTITFVEGPLTIVGVMPERFWYPMRNRDNTPELDLIAPRALLAKSSGPNSWTMALARLAPGASMPQANAQLAVLAGRHSRPLGEYTFGLRADSLRALLSKDARQTLLTLFGVVACLLLICCVNIASFLVSRSQSRLGEFAVRATLGASWRRLFRQLFTEYMVLALCGGAVGLLVTALTIDAFLTLVPKTLLVVRQIELDLRMVAIAVGVTLMTGILSGIAPALIAARSDLGASLKVGYRRFCATTHRRTVGNALLVVEAAFLLVLLSASALLCNSFIRLRTIDIGFDRKTLWTSSVVLPEELYPDNAQMASFVERTMDRLRAMPGVVAVANADWGPLGGSCPGQELSIDGRDLPEPQIRHVSAGYFDTVALTLVRGRLFAGKDEGGLPRVAVVNQSAARRYWPNQEPIGRHAVVNKKFKVEIVGIVRDMREQNERKAPGPSIYVPMNPSSGEFFNARTLVVRTAQEMTALEPAIASRVASVDPRIPADTERLDATLAVRMQDERFYAVFVGLVALFGLLLAGVGIAGVAAQGVVSRTHEIGVRLALGADVSGVVRLVVRQVSVPVVIGIGVGIGGAVTATGVLRALLYEVTPHDPLTHVLSTVLLLLIALLAAYLPARRASRIDPVEALRVE